MFIDLWINPLSRIGFPSLINLTSLFPFQGLLGGIFHIYSDLMENYGIKLLN